MIKIFTAIRPTINPKSPITEPKISITKILTNRTGF